jgi:hypothetical protein
MAEGWLAHCSELQIDCDWTPSTREAYFRFLKLLQAQCKKKQISSTLRLWQYRDRDKAGIPPVKRCHLMLYSTGNPDEFSPENSIAETKLISGYLEAPAYPLQLDIALPIFSWASLFRDGRFVSLIRNYSSLPIADTDYFAPGKGPFLTVKRDTIFEKNYLRMGDLLKIEEISPEQLTEIVTLAHDKASLNENSRITLFSWDSTYFKRYNNELLIQTLNHGRR